LKEIDASMMRNETLFEATEGLHERVVGEVRTLEDWYSAEFERRLAALTEVLNSQLEARVEEVRKQFQEQYEALEQEASRAASTPSPAAPAPSPATPQGPSTELLDELSRNEASGQRIASELERMVADDTVPLGKLLQLRNQELELKAYIRGLKFGITANTPAADTPEKNTA
jgi:hypothetical protein